MQPGRVLVVFALAVFVGGALLAPWLYALAQWGAGHFPALEPLARNPFHRFVNRAMLVLALAGIWPLMRTLGMRSWREIGWVSPRGEFSRLGWGFALGFAALALVAVLALLAGAWELNPQLEAIRFLRKLLSALVTAVVVAILEETFFRGAVMGALRRVHSAGTALLASSMIYALVHFFQRPESPATVRWYSGLQILLRMLHGFVDWQSLVPGFFVLTLAGLILGVAYLRTGNLYCSMGLHAGWIFWLKFCGVVAVVRPEADAWIWGSRKMIDGWLALAVLACLFLIIRRLPLSSSHHVDAGRLDHGR